MSEAARAAFVLMQSGQPEARETVVYVAKEGPEPARLAAVRELGRFGGPEVSTALMQVYRTSNTPVKRQVVMSLGQRQDCSSLLQIAEAETDQQLREKAILTLGQAGGHEQLRVLYRRTRSESKLPIIVGLFNARDDDELIQIAQNERDPKLRAEALRRLSLMDTPKAKAYLRKINHR